MDPVVNGELFDTSSMRRDPAKHWDAARAAHHLGTKEMPYDPFHASREMGQVYTPDVARSLAARGKHYSSLTPESIDRGHGHLEPHEWRDPNGNITPVSYRSPRERQTIMTVHEGALQAPGRIHIGAPDDLGTGVNLSKAKVEFDANHPNELDAHGNVEDSRHPSFAKYAPQRNPDAAKVFAEHGRVVDLHPHTPLHTGQGAWSTGDLSDVRGPMRPDTELPVIMKDGTPYLMDGHHRRAGAAARGETIRARIVNHEQFSGLPGFE